jgi:hypothetical protein
MLVVEAPIPKADGSVAPGVGVITAVNSNGSTPLGGMNSLHAGDESLMLDASYAPLIGGAATAQLCYCF